jgi:hypothetical protein
MFRIATKTTLTILIVCAICGMMFAQTPASKPKVAVYVTGGKSPSENKVLGAKLTNILVNSGQYLTIERSDAFLNQVRSRTGQTAQRGG